MQRRRSARTVEDCLKNHGDLARLSSHAARLMQLQILLAASLPVGLVRHARVANLKAGRLIIHAENGAVAAKLRQLLPRLTNRFTSLAAEVNGIDVRVQARPVIQRPVAAKAHNPIGDIAKRSLTSLNESLPEGSALRQALARLVEKG